MAQAPLKVRPEHWFSAAARGDVAQLDRWVRGKVLSHRFEPTRVNALPGPGRPTFFRLLDKQGDTALMAALRAYRAEYAVRLLELGAVPGALMGGPAGAFGLVARIQDPHLPLERLVELLVSQGHDLDECPAGGDCPLAVAAQLGNVPVLKLLLAAGASVNPRHGDLPLCAAVSVCAPQAVECLLAAGANPNRENTNDKQLPLVSVVAGWGSKAKDSELDSPRRNVARQLLAAGADPDWQYVESTGERLTVRDFLPNNAEARAAFEADCAWAVSQRLSQHLPRPSLAGPLTKSRF